jgi:hypothetical protein
VGAGAPPPLLFPVVQEQTGLSNLQRLAIVVGAIVVLVVAYVVISGGDDEKSSDSTQPAASQPASTQSTDTGTTGSDTSGTETATPPAPPTVRVVDAKPQGGIKKLSFDKGDQIRFRVVSDTADEIHVHGYDLMKDVAKGGSVTFSFKGSIDGRFVVELEDHGEQIAELDVQP